MSVDHFAEAVRLLALAEEEWRSNRTNASGERPEVDRFIRWADVHARLADIDARNREVTS